jgi:hypothetical protein
MKWMTLCGFGMLSLGLIDCASGAAGTSTAKMESGDSQGTVEHTSWPPEKASQTASEDEVQAGALQPTPAAGPDAQPRPVLAPAAVTNARIERIDARIAGIAGKVDHVELRARPHAYSLLETVKRERAAVDTLRTAPGQTSTNDAAAMEDALGRLERDLDELERSVGK